MNVSIKKESCIQDKAGYMGRLLHCAQVIMANILAVMVACRKWVLCSTGLHAVQLEAAHCAAAVVDSSETCTGL